VNVAVSLHITEPTRESSVWNLPYAPYYAGEPY